MNLKNIHKNNLIFITNSSIIVPTNKILYILCNVFPYIFYGDGQKTFLGGNYL